MYVTKAVYNKLHDQVQSIQNNMDYNIKLFLGREDEEKAEESGKCRILIINKYGIPVQICYKNVGDHRWRDSGKVLKVDEERQITTYQGVRWGVKIAVDPDLDPDPDLDLAGVILASEVIEAGFRNNVLIIEDSTKMMRKEFICDICNNFKGLFIDVMKHEMTCQGTGPEAGARSTATGPSPRLSARGAPEPGPQQEGSIRLSPASDQGEARKSAKRKKSIKKKKKRSKRKNKRASKKR